MLPPSKLPAPVTSYTRQKAAIDGPQRGLDFCRRPKIELAFLAFAVGVFAAIESAQRIGHVAEQIVERLTNHVGVTILAGGLPGFEIAGGQQTVVVKHFSKCGTSHRGSTL